MIIETQLPNLLHRGKVRDTYDLGDGLLFMVATDRISAFDVVLPNGIPYKGMVLAQMSAFWFRSTADLIDNHFIAMADDAGAVERYRGTPLLAELSAEIASQAMIVKRAERIDVECIARGYLTGSAWAEYKRSGTLWGQALPQGLIEGEALPEPLFTPTTKAEEGHDQSITLREVADMVGEDTARQLEEKTLALYSFAHDYARQRGIILADTKMEFGLLDGKLILIDELLTPDSSRFWDAEGYEAGRSLPNFDKQYVRDWLDSQGWNREPPAPSLPEDVVQRTSQRYVEAYRRLTGEELSIHVG
jgi:phosphoribosylaminoimidazole-succinocarboxamide synthase